MGPRLLLVRAAVLYSLVTGVHSLTVTVSPGSVSVSPGASQSFTCRYTLPLTAEDKKVEWFKDTGVQPASLLWKAETTLSGSYSGPGSGYDLTRLSGFPATLPDILSQHSLTFLNIQPQDDGDYFCRVVYKDKDSTASNGTSTAIRIAVEGAQKIAENGVVSSNMYPNPYNRTEREVDPMYVTITDGDYLILWLDDLDLPPPTTPPTAALYGDIIMTSCTEYIRVFEVDSSGKSYEIARLCGNIDLFHPWHRYIVSYQKEVYIEFTVDYDIVFEGRGFRFLYTTGYTECPGEIIINRQPLGLIASRQIFNHTRRCEEAYNITVEPAAAEITVLYFESEYRCTSENGYLDINNGIIYCGGDLKYFCQTTVLSNISEISFTANFGTNFLIMYKDLESSLHAILSPENFTMSQNATRFELDDGAILEGSNCTWIVQAPEGSIIELSGEFTPYGPSYDLFCQYNRLYVVDDADNTLFYHCPGTNNLRSPSGLLSQSNLVYVHVDNVTREAKVSFRWIVSYYPASIAGNPSVEEMCIPPGPAPSIDWISPEIGILAGGTQLTITGHHFPPSKVFLAYGKYSATSTEACSPTHCAVLTSVAHSEDVDVRLHISVTFPGRAPIITPFVFTYKANPQVDSIYPLKTLAAGGTTLTVSGEGFDAVNDPHLLVHMIHTLQRNNISTRKTFTSPCRVNSSDALKCPTPQLDLPEQFQRYRNRKEGASDNPGSGENYRWEIPGQSLEFTLGILLDGDQSNMDLSESNPEYSQLNVFALGPEFDVFSGSKPVESDEVLRVTGRRLDDGLDITDYTVRIGVGTCTMKDLTTNELLCVVPQQDSLGEEEEHSVLVHPGANLSPHVIGSVQYKTVHYLGIIIGVSAGGGVLLVAIVYIRCRMKSPQEKKQEAQERQGDMELRA